MDVFLLLFYFFAFGRRRAASEAHSSERSNQSKKLTPEVVVRYGRLCQDVGAARERDVEVVQDRQGVRRPMLLHQQMLQEKLEAMIG